MTKFELPPLLPKPASKIVHIRFPASIDAQIRDKTKGTTCTFSAFVIEATRFALENMEPKK